jgi:hypothetical protein
MAGVARPALLLYLEEQRVAVTVEPGLLNHLGMSAGLALHPLLLARPAPVHHPATLQGLAEGGLGHVRHHEDLVGLGVLDDGGHQAVAIEGYGVEKRIGCGHRER